MGGKQPLTPIERILTLFTRVHPGEGRCVLLLCLQAFALMLAYYLIRPVREALILTEGTAELRSYAVGVQALLLIVLIPAYGLLLRRVPARRVYALVNGFFALNLVVFFLLGQSGQRFSFAFFVWGSIFGVMAVTQFWAFATDLVDVPCGKRLFGIIAVGVSAGAWAGSRLAAAGFEAIGPYGLMLAAAAVLCVAICISERVRQSVPAASRSTHASDDTESRGRAGSWLGGIAVIAGNRYLVAIAALVVLLNWITSTGDFVLSSWLAEVARAEAPESQARYIGRFMSEYCATVTLVGFLIQLLLVSRIIDRAGIGKALLVTPLVFLAGYFFIGMVPVFALLQSTLVIQRSLDYSLLNTARSALLLPASRDVKYQAKTAIDTLFYRLGDLISTFGIFLGMRVFDEPRLQFVWLIVVLSVTMTLVAWFIAREYSRRFGDATASRADGPAACGRHAVLAQ